MDKHITPYTQGIHPPEACALSDPSLMTYSDRCIIAILVFLSVAGTVLDSLDRLAIAEEGAILTGDNNTMLPSDKIVLFYNPSSNNSQWKGGIYIAVMTFAF